MMRTRKEFILGAFFLGLCFVFASPAYAKCGKYLAKARDKGLLTDQAVSVLAATRKDRNTHLSDAAYAVLASLEGKIGRWHDKLVDDLGLSNRWSNEVNRRLSLRKKTNQKVKKAIAGWKTNDADFMAMEMVLDLAHEGFRGRGLGDVILGRDRGKALASRIHKRHLNELLAAYKGVRHLVKGQKRYHTLDAMADQLGFSEDRALFRELMRYLLTEYSGTIRRAEWSAWD